MGTGDRTSCHSQPRAASNVLLTLYSSRSAVRPILRREVSSWPVPREAHAEREAYERGPPLSPPPPETLEKLADSGRFNC